MANNVITSDDISVPFVDSLVHGMIPSFKSGFLNVYTTGQLESVYKSSVS